MRNRRFLILGIMVLATLAGTGLWAGVAAQPGERYFPETGQTVRGRFLAYWTSHGGLAQQGYPLTGEFAELSPTDGKTYTVQYFERAIFEYHPENASTPYEVLLSLVGVDAYQARYPNRAPDQHPHPQGIDFPQTGHTLGGSFRTYWEQHGGLAQQGYPISDEFTELSALDNKPYTVQYFQRAVFEYHPEHKGTPYEVLLAQLGTYRYQALYGGLVVPGPLPGRVQSNPRGSDRFLVWNEARPARSGGAAIRAFDLTARRALTVTTNAGDDPAYDLSGSIVAWDEMAAGCLPNCTRGDIRGLDLATGQAFAIATGPRLRYSPAISGRTVAWVEINNATAQLLLKDLGAPTATLVTTSTYESSPYFYEGFGTLQISPQYVVWTVVSSRSAGSNTYHYATLRAYNRQTGAIQDVSSYGGGPYDHGPQLRGYALDGEQLFWFADGLQVLNLRTGERRQVFGPLQDYGDQPAYLGGVRANVVYWLTGPQVNGWRLDRPGVLNLVDGHEEGVTTEATIAGDWLVWHTCADYNPLSCGALRAAPVDRLFAANHPPPAYMSPTPSPLPPTATPNPRTPTLPPFPTYPPIPPTPGLSPPPPTAPPVAALVIPTPRAGYSQSAMRGSDQYLVWTEERAGVAGSSDAVGLDLASGRRISVAEGAGDQRALALNGEFAVWEDRHAPCPPCGGDLYIQTLSNGQNYGIVPDERDVQGATVVGGALGWMTDDGDYSRIRLWDGPSTRTLTQTRDSNTVPSLSALYVAWSDANGGVMAYNRATGQTRAIPGATAQSWGGTALAGDTLFWGGDQVRYRHLDTDAGGIVINARASVRGVYGNTLLWTDDTGIWGARLPDLLPTRLVAASGSAAPDSPTVAGGWLVWQQRGVWQAAPLVALFAGPPYIPPTATIQR